MHDPNSLKRENTWQIERRALVDHLVTALQADQRVVAVWFAGSHGRGTADAWSDIDLGIVLTNEAMPALLSEPLAFVEAIALTVMHIESPQNAPAGGTHLLTMIAGRSGPQQVDWYWIPESIAIRPADTRLVFERQSIPLAPAPAPLNDIEIEQALTASLRDALQMAFMVGKHLRRQDLTAALRALDYVVTCTGKATWYETHDMHPDHAQIRRLQLHGTPPATLHGIVQQANGPMAELTSLIGRHAPELVPMLEQVLDWLESSADAWPE